MRYLLKAWPDDDYWDAAYAASVTISPKQAKRYLEIINEVVALKEAHGVWRVSIHDYTPVWYKYNEDLEIVDDGGFLRIADDFETFADTIRQDATSLHVDETSIWWSSYEKHTTARMYTAEITREELEQLIKEET